MIRALLGLALLAGAPARAEHRPFSVDRMTRPRPEPGGVSYYGGPVIGRVKVHLVFWGAGAAPEVQSKLEAFYRGIVDSTYMDRLAEYATNVRAGDGRPGTGQAIGRGTFGAALTISPANKSTRLTQADVERELEAQIRGGALPKPDADSLYMLHFPDGYRVTISFGESCVSWYADHEVYRSPSAGSVYYALFPCRSGDMGDFDTLTFAASHELAEAVTDPMSPLSGEPAAYPAGWLRADGEEIGDLCTGSRGTFSDGGAAYSVNPAWLNSRGACDSGGYSRRAPDARLSRAADGAALAELKALQRRSAR